MRNRISLTFAALLLTLPLAAQDRTCYEHTGRLAKAEVAVERSPWLERLVKYTRLALKHRVNGLASYYSSFFDGRKTANGEIFRNGKYSAAHLTLPLGTWVEVKARATGRKLRLRVNDRGPYAKKFCLDLSQAAARYLGVDVARDRHVDVRIIALPGEEPLPEDLDLDVELAQLDQEGSVKQNVVPSSSFDSTVSSPP